MIGLPIRTLSTISEQQMLKLAGKILHDPSHILFSEFEWLPSGRRLRFLGCRTQRRKATFIPKVVQLLNSQSFLTPRLTMLRLHNFKKLFIKSGFASWMSICHVIEYIHVVYSMTEL